MHARSSHPLAPCMVEPRRHIQKRAKAPLHNTTTPASDCPPCPEVMPLVPRGARARTIPIPLGPSSVQSSHAFVS